VGRPAVGVLEARDLRELPQPIVGKIDPLLRHRIAPVLAGLVPLRTGKRAAIPADLAPTPERLGIAGEMLLAKLEQFFHAGFVGWSAERSRSSNERLSWDVAGCREWARQLVSSAQS
jgi:hypothetical protein